MMRKSALLVMVCLMLVIRIFPQRALGENENRAFEVLKTSLSFSNVIKDKVWPGFDLSKYAFVLTDPESGAYLIGFDKAPEGTTRVATTLFDSPVYFTRDNRIFAGNTSQIVAGKNTAVIQINSIAGNSTKGLESALGLVFHEAFHAFQRDNTRGGVAWPAENIMILPDYPDDSTKTNALFRIEGQILCKTLLTSNRDELIALAKQFIAVRNQRQQSIDPIFSQFEKHVELNEGLADYAETKAEILAVDMVNRKEINLVLKNTQTSELLSSRFAPLNSINKIGSNVRQRFYYTGAAQGLLLDNLMPGWKKRVQFDAASLQDLLGEAVDSGSQSSNRNSQVSPDAILKQYDYDAMVKDEEQIVSGRKARRQALVDSIENRSTYTIDVSALGRMGNYKSFDPWNEVPVTRQKRVHTSVLSVDQEGLYKAYFSQSVIEDIGVLKYVTAIGPGDKQEISVDGIAINLSEPVVRRFEKSLKIKTANFELEASSGIIIISSKGVVIKIGKNLPSVSDADREENIAERTDALAARFLNLQLSDANGQVHKLSELKGQQVYVLFITAQSWAKPAHNFFDALSSIAGEQARFQENTRFIVIASGNTPQQLREFMKSHHAEVTVLLDDNDVAVTLLAPVPGDIQYPFLVGISASVQRNYGQSGYTQANVDDARKHIFAPR